MLPEAATAPQKTILIVEDDQDIRESFREVLNLVGYDVIVAANGQEALDFLSGSKKPNLILLDLMMPTMNGWQFREQQKADPRISDVPIVVISADVNLKQKASGIEAKEYLKKPIELETLLQVAEKFCTPESSGAVA